MGWTFYNASGQRLQAFGFVAATQAEMEAGSSTTAYVTPGRAQHHPGVAKGHGGTNGGAGVLDTGSYNVASVTRDATGTFTFAWTTDFSSGNYQVVSSLATDNSGDDRPLTHKSKGGSRIGASITNYALDASGSAKNGAHEVAAFGDQA